MRIKYFCFYMSLVAPLFLVSACNRQGQVRVSNITGEVKNVVVLPRDGVGYFDSYDLISDILMTKDRKRLIFYGQKVHYNTLLDPRMRKIIEGSMRKYVRISILYFYLNPGPAISVNYYLHIPKSAPEQIKRKALAMGFKEIKHNLVPENKGSLKMSIYTSSGYIHRNTYKFIRSGKSAIQPARIVVSGDIDIYGGKNGEEFGLARLFRSASDARQKTTRVPFKPIVHTDFVFKSHKGAKAYEIELLTKGTRFRLSKKR